MLEHHVTHLLYKAYTHIRGLKFTHMNWIRRPKGFSHGTNMRQLVNSFRNFILTGKCGKHWEYKGI
ncbi:hypothetical protein FA037_05385 [Bacillus amyloliquefaciens]|nr:hypothetical protein FA037_05385 [Bacillus amyloliquefaciens]